MMNSMCAYFLIQMMINVNQRNAATSLCTVHICNHLKYYGEIIIKRTYLLHHAFRLLMDYILQVLIPLGELV
jgi:hypothetical protein